MTYLLNYRSTEANAPDMLRLMRPVINVVHPTLRTLKFNV